MSNDNDPRDDAMREIEAALDNLIDVTQYHADKQRFPRKARADALALIRSKLPQPTADAGGWGEDDDRFRANEEHERAVEAWCEKVKSQPVAWNLELTDGDMEEALRLMRARPASEHPAPQIHGKVAVYVNPDDGSWARPASGKDEAAGELLRAAKVALPYVETIHDSEALGEAIAKAERAGIKP